MHFPSKFYLPSPQQSKTVKENNLQLKKKMYQQNLFTKSNAKLPSQNYCIRVHQSKLKFNYQLLITLAVEKNKIMHVVCEA